MSLMKTLAKVAIGVAVAKGVGSMMKRGTAEAGGSGGGQTYGGQHSPEPGGFEERMGEMLGKSARQDNQGGLGDLLDQLGGAKPERGRAPGGASLEDLLGGLTGGASNSDRGGLGDLLGGRGAQTSGGGGGLGDLLGGLLGSATTQGSSGSFGDLLNQSLQRGGDSLHESADATVECVERPT